MNLFRKILKGIVKFSILFLCSIFITLLSAKIPIAGRDHSAKIPVMDIELYPLADSICGDMAVGLPFAYDSKFKNHDGSPEDAMICSNPGRILRRLIMFFFDNIFWLAFLYLSVNFWKKFIKFFKSRRSIHAN